MGESRETSFVVDSCICGYHPYQAVWLNPVLREALTCPGIVMIYLQWQYKMQIALLFCNLFIRDGGTLDGSVNGSKHYSHGIPEGGVEIPCNYTFSGSAFLTEKTRRCLIELQEKVPAIENVSDCTTSTISLPPVTQKISVVSDSACAVPVTSSSESNLSAPSSDSAWVKIRDIALKNSDKAIIEQGLEFTDIHINCA